MERSLLSKNDVEAHLNNAKLIKKLNDTKQYTLMATGLLESIVTDPNLTASAAKLWEYLYTKAIINRNLCVNMRYKDIADKFNRTERTIKRQVENLKENGYLHVKSNFHSHGQRANTFYLTVPRTLAENLKNSKDRKKVTKETPQIIHEECAVKADIHSNEPRKIEQTLTLMDEASTINLSPKKDKIVTPSHDKNVTSINNNIKKDILINNNDVVVSESHSKKQTVLESKKETLLAENLVLRETLTETQDILDQERIDEIERNVNSLYVTMGNTNGSEKIAILNEIQKLQATASMITVTINQRKQAIKPIDATAMGKSPHFIDPSINFMQTEGDRKLNDSNVSIIKKTVEKFIPQNNQQRICNEIIYAIRFGTLRISQTGCKLSIPHAISIALKLLRENRWETPAQLKQKEKLDTYFEKREDRKQYKNYTHIGNRYAREFGQIIGRQEEQRRY